MSEDPHSPTTAGHEPDQAAPEPTPTVGAAQASYGRPAGSVLLDTGEQEDPHPERLVGAAFAGGLVAALFLKGLARRRHA